MSPWLLQVLDCCLGLFGISMLIACWRLLMGPSALDRVLALDTLYVNALAVVVLLGIRWETAVYFEAALVIALLGFVGTAVLARKVAGQPLIDARSDYLGDYRKSNDDAGR
jgi:multicomponent K+:H+ antiporter subunit F